MCVVAFTLSVICYVSIRSKDNNHVHDKKVVGCRPGAGWMKRSKGALHCLWEEYGCRFNPLQRMWVVDGFAGGAAGILAGDLERILALDVVCVCLY